MKSLVHDTWAQAMRAIADTHHNPDCRDVAAFAANVLELCEPTEKLAQYLDNQALVMLEGS